jgi:hypothetical protein
MILRSIGTCVASMPLRSDVSKDSDTGNSKVVIDLSHVPRRGGIWGSVFLATLPDGGDWSTSCCERLPSGKEFTGYEDGPVANPFCTLQRRAVCGLCRSPSHALIMLSRSGVGVREV